MKNNQVSRYYPIFLNTDGKRCVVVGGGQVALRKVRMLLEFGGKVEAVSPEFCSELKKLAENGSVKLVRKRYQPGDLQGALVVIAATNSIDINAEVVKEARRKKILVNVVDDADNSDFIVPSYLRRGSVAIAISTSGLSPALARRIRHKLEEQFGEEYAALALLINEVRAEAKDQQITTDATAWQEAINLDILTELIRQGNSQKAKSIILNTLKQSRN